MELVRITAPLSVYFDKSGIPADVLENASRRGSAAHAACAAYARRLPVLCPDDARPFFESFRQWFDQFVLEALFIEAEFTDPRTWFLVGHVDLVCRLIDRRVAVVDYKTPQQSKAVHFAQVAGYRHLVDPVIKTDTGFPLILDKQGGPAKAVESPNGYATDWANYLAALQAYRAFAVAA